MQTFSIPHDLVGHAALSLSPALAKLVGRDRVELSMGSVKTIDASGVALLVRLQSHLACRGGSLELTELTTAVAQELARIGLAKLLVARPTIEPALTPLPSPAR